MNPQTISTAPKIEADGFVFTECPRWHDGQFYFCDMLGNRVCRLGANGQVETLLELDDNAGGLGFLPDGDLLIVSMRKAKLVRRSKKDGSVREHADLSGVASHGINDMVVDAAGRAYVGQFGYDHSKPQAPQPSPIVLVDAAGGASLGPDAVMMANGLLLSDDGRTLIFAESAGGRISAYDVGADASLSNLRVYAALPPQHYPDGICLDAEGGVWVACVTGPGFVRVLEGGAVTHFVPMPAGRFACACMLGGADRKTLYLCTSERYDPAHLASCKSSRIESIRVDVAGVGRP